MGRNIYETAVETIDTFVEIVRSFPPEKFNMVPFEKSWTPAQVTDHMLKAVSGLPSMLRGPVIPTVRKPDEKVGTIEKVFLDFSTKMKSPEFILPSEAPLNKEALLQSWAETKAELLKVITDLDLSMTSTVFELPGMGGFTRLEWIWFSICHIKRHTHQLKNIYRVAVEGVVEGTA